MWIVMVMLRLEVAHRFQSQLKKKPKQPVHNTMLQNVENRRHKHKERSKEKNGLSHNTYTKRKRKKKQ